MKVRIDISGLLIDFDTRYPEYVQERCKGYLTESDSADILELRSSDEDCRKSYVEEAGEKEAELYAMTIPLSEILPERNRIMTHGVAIACDGYSYLFTAPSGVGKSTHAFLWQKLLGHDRVRVINGDKPILWFREDGEILACGTPWSGKEHLDENVCVPLKGICLLHRLSSSPEGGPRIFRASREETLDFLINQIFLPHASAGQLKTFALLEELYEKVPVFNLITDMSREGVLISVNCLLGNAE